MTREREEQIGSFSFSQSSFSFSFFESKRNTASTTGEATSPYTLAAASHQHRKRLVPPRKHDRQQIRSVQNEKNAADNAGRRHLESKTAVGESYSRSQEKKRGLLAARYVEREPDVIVVVVIIVVSRATTPVLARLGYRRQRGARAPGSPPSRSFRPRATLSHAGTLTSAISRTREKK